MNAAWPASSALRAAVAGLALLCLCPLSGAAERIGLRWALLKPGADELLQEVIDVRETPRVTTGDRLQIYLATDDTVFLYVFLFDSGRNLHLLFPPRIERYATQALAPGTYLLPSETGWFNDSNWYSFP